MDRILEEARRRLIAEEKLIYEDEDTFVFGDDGEQSAEITISKNRMKIKYLPFKTTR